MAMGMDNHATVVRLSPSKYPLLPLKFTAGNPDFGTFGQVQFIRLKIKKMIIVKRVPDTAMKRCI